MKLKISQARKILNNRTPEKLKETGYVRCSRCGGSGNYSYNPIHGSTCFQCNGLGFMKLKGGK